MSFKKECGDGGKRVRRLKSVEEVSINKGKLAKKRDKGEIC